MAQPPKAVSEAISSDQRLWFSGGIAAMAESWRDGIYEENADFSGTLDVSTFWSSSSPSLPPSFPFLLASAVPLLSWTFDAVLH